MPGIFICYRREDDPYAGRLADNLRARFGEDLVFRDDQLIGGVDFVDALERAVRNSDVLLVVIGPNWFPPPSGRDDDETDFVGKELRTAHEANVPIRPVCVDRAHMPTQGELPADLRWFSRIHASTLDSGRRWSRDVEALAGDLAPLIDRTHAAPSTKLPRERSLLQPRTWGWVAAVLVVLVVGAVVARFTSPGSEEEALEPPPCEASAGGEWNDLVIGDTAEQAVPMDTGSFVFGVQAGRWRQMESGVWRVILNTTMENATPEAAYHGHWLYQALVVAQRVSETACFSPDPELVLADTVGDARVGFQVSCPPEGYIELVLGEDTGRLNVTSDTLDPGAC